MKNKLTALVQGKGIQLNDTLHIQPLWGSNRKIRLKRTKYHLIHKDNPQKEFLNPHILLEDCSIETHFLIESFPLKDTKELSLRYKISSVCQTPLQVDGLPTFDVILMQKSILFIDDVKLTFSPKNESMLKQIEHPILANTSMIKSNLNIILEGETGSGKSFLASKIHQKSERSGPFVQIDLSTFSENLIESELFGHIKGAFTGAASNKLGKLLSAQKGTIFIDEIDSLPYHLQSKLLLFLDNSMVTPVGGLRADFCDARIIFATGSDLKAKVKQGAFRKDLYYRLTSEFTLKLRPLREDPQMIDQICLQFMHKNHLIIDQELITFYKSLTWPGNIRQFLGHLRKKKELSNQQILKYDETDFPLTLGESDLLIGKTIGPIFTLDYIKKQYSQNVFRLTGKNLKKTAKILGVTQATTRKMLQSTYPSSMDSNIKVSTSPSTSLSFSS